jgi:AcrR family transcriptional regulator
MKICPENSTVNKIIEAAIPLFATKGFAAVSVKELAEAAGVNIALISYHFGGKEKLYTFILNDQVEVMKQLIMDLKASTTDPVEKIKSFVACAVRIHKSRPYIGQLINSEHMNPTECAFGILQQIGAGVHNFLKECVQEAIAEGKFRASLQPDYAAMALGGMMHVFFAWRYHCACLTFTKEQGEEYLKQGLELFFQGALCSDLKKGLAVN